MKNNNKLTIYIFGVAMVVFCVPALLGTVRAETQETIVTSTTPVLASSTPTLRGSSSLIFLGNQNIAPIVFLEEGEPVGIAVDITNALAPYLSRPIEIRAMDWSAAQALVAEGEADVLVQINQTEERKIIYDFSDTLLESQFSVFASANRVDILGLSSLHGLRVGVEKGGLPQKTLEIYPDIELVIIPNFLDGFKQLGEGTIDVVVVDYRVGSYVLAKKNIQNIIAVGEPIAFSYSSFAVKKGNAELLSEINFALQTIKDNGMYQAILNKWQKTEAVFKTREQITRAIYVAIIAVLLVLSLFVIAWSTVVSRELSKRRKAERDLATTIATLKESQSMAHLGSWELDLITNKLTWSDEIYKIFETDQEKFGASYEAFLKAIHPEDRERVNAAYTESVKSHKPYGIDHRLLVGDGRIKYVHERCETFYDENSKPVRSVGTVQDITERKMAEEKLRKSESLLSVLIDTIPIPVFFKDRVGRYIGFNKAYEDFFGATKENLIGKTVFDINPPELAVVYNAKDDELFNTGGVQVYSSQVKSLDKGLREVVFNKAIFPDEKGSPAGLVGAILDVTEEKHFQREIELKNTILKTEQEVSLDAILTVDEHEKIISYNSKFVSMFHLSPEMVAVGIDEPVLRAVTELSKDPKVFIERVQYLYAHHEEKSRDEIILKDRRVIDRYSAPLVDKEGVYRGRVWYFRDITDRKEEEERLKELDKLKDDFLMVTTHELKSPLIPIKAQAQLFLAGDYGELSQEQRSAMEMILRNEEAINGLANEVLDISKIKSNKLKLVLELEDVGEIVAEVVGDMRDISIQKQLTLTLLPIPVLPKILVDRLRVKQVLLNILNNALKFTPEGGSVSVRVDKNENEIEIRVIDIGIGISKEDIKKLFVPFSRIESDVTRKYRGTGLGLAISKGLVETHGGKIWAESDGEGKGSTFAFTLPIGK